MSKPCEASGSQRGVFVETRSGDIHGTLCTLSTGAQVSHIVRVENLMLYPASISCRGFIAADPRRVDFTSPRPGDTAATSGRVTLKPWEASGQGARAGGSCRCGVPMPRMAP